MIFFSIKWLSWNEISHNLYGTRLDVENWNEFTKCVCMNENKYFMNSLRNLIITHEFLIQCKGWIPHAITLFEMCYENSTNRSHFSGKMNATQVCILPTNTQRFLSDKTKETVLSVDSHACAMHTKNVNERSFVHFNWILQISDCTRKKRAGLIWQIHCYRVNDSCHGLHFG